MIKKFLAYMPISCACLFASCSAANSERERFATERDEVNVRRATGNVKRIPQTFPDDNVDTIKNPASVAGCLYVVGCLTLDTCINSLFSESGKSIGVPLATLSYLSQDLVEKKFGKERRKELTQALLVAGVCLDSKVTIVSYLSAYGLDKLASRQVTTTILCYLSLDIALYHLVPRNLNHQLMTTSMMFSAANTIIPDVVELIAGTSYRETIIQAMFVAGLCLAPKITIGSYAVSWVFNRLSEGYIANPVKRVFSYWTARAGGLAGSALSMNWGIW
ncbi:MAG: hypothetical protein WCN27_00890 [Alphaproteobacteria bacterium]